MPDPFKNARPYYDVTFPSSGDGLSIAAMKNALQGIGFLDMIPLQPRAHSPADTKIMVRGRDASGFFNPLYFGDSNARLAFVSGDTPAISAPASNPRIDIVYITPSGDIKVLTGTEAVSPTLPSLSPSGDTRMPVCAIWCKPSQTKIVNFEDKDSNTGDSYIYQDLRPWLRGPGAGSATLTTASPVSTGTGDLPGTATTAARADHAHTFVRGIRIPGQPLLKGEAEIASSASGDLTQSGNRITHNGINLSAYAFINGLTGTLFNGFNVAGVVRNSTGNYTITWATPFSDANYAITFGINPNGSSAYQALIITQLPGSVNFATRQTDNQTLQDALTVSIMAVRT